jgi:hypothetical protein
VRPRLAAHSAPIEDLFEAPLTRRVLVDLKTRSLRRRVWYRVLDRIERGLVDLTIRWVDKIRNRTMTSVLLRILGKLAQAMQQGMARVLILGRELALRASSLAVEWGYRDAYAWRLDKSFWRGLGTICCLRR